MNLKDYFSKGMKNSIVEMETIPNPDEANEACKSKVEEDTSIDTEKEPKKDEETPQLIDGEIDFEQVAKDAAPTADDLQGEPSETPSTEPVNTEEMPSEPVATDDEPLPPVETDDSGEYLEPIEDDEDKEAVPEAEEEDSVEEMPDGEEEFEEIPDDENFEEMPNDEDEVEEMPDDEVVEDDTSVEMSDDDADVEEISDEDVEEISDDDVEEEPVEDNDEVEEISDEDDEVDEVDGNESDDEYIQSVRAGHDSALIDHGVEVGYNLAASMLKKYYEGKINEETLMTTLKRRKSIYESITGSSTGKKTELNGQSQPVKTSAPVKTEPTKITEPVKTNPVKTAEPVKTAPVKTSEPVKTEPAKTSEPVKTEPVKTSEPDKKVQPVNESKGAYQQMNENRDKIQKEKFMNELFSLPIENQSQLNESNKEIAELQQKLIESQKQLIVERAVSPLTEMQKINVRPMLDELTRSINDVDKFKTMVNNAVALVSTQKPEQKATVVESVSINNNNNADNDIVKKAMSLIDKIR